MSTSYFIGCVFLRACCAFGALDCISQVTSGTGFCHHVCVAGGLVTVAFALALFSFGKSKIENPNSQIPQ